MSGNHKCALVVAAHPDDEVLGAGGTVRRLADQGIEVHCLIVCEGETVRYGGDHREVVADQTARAAKILGYESLLSLGLPDQRLDHLSLLDVIRPIEEGIARIKPSLILTHFGGDLNRDHRVVSEAVLVATRPFSAPSVREVLTFETPSSTEWGSDVLLPTFKPTVFYNIEESLDAKVEALEQYVKEIQQAPHPRSSAVLRAHALYWGSQVAFEAAEAFQVVRDKR